MLDQFFKVLVLKIYPYASGCPAKTMKVSDIKG
jgi:hypothetical protein